MPLAAEPQIAQSSSPIDVRSTGSCVGAAPPGSCWTEPVSEPPAEFTLASTQLENWDVLPSAVLVAVAVIAVPLPAAGNENEIGGLVAPFPSSWTPATVPRYVSPCGELPHVPLERKISMSKLLPARSPSPL